MEPQNVIVKYTSNMRLSGVLTWPRQYLTGLIDAVVLPLCFGVCGARNNCVEVVEAERLKRMLV